MRRAELRIGTQVGPYRVESILGEGSMGVVYRALDSRNGEIRALKTLLPMFRGDDERERRFVREAKVSTLLTNPNTVRVFDFGRADDGTYYLAMELLSGQSLRKLMRRFAPLGLGLVADLGVQICRSLAEAHRNGLVHRDLKPENIFVCEDDHGGPLVRVLDYGLARTAAGGSSPPPAGVSDLGTLTVAGALIGTPTYMSPEQCMAEPIDARSDLYTLGCLLYEMLSGRPPFQDDNALRLMARHVHEPHPALHAEGAAVPLVALIDRLLSKDRAARPAAAMDVIEVLLDLLDTDEARATQPPPAPLVDDATVADFPAAFAALGTAGGAPEDHEDRTAPWVGPRPDELFPTATIVEASPSTLPFDPEVATVPDFDPHDHAGDPGDEPE